MTTTLSENAANTAVSLAHRTRPLPATLDVRAARDAYLAENGFDTASYTAPTFEVEAFGRTRTLRNTDDRKWAIPLHDLHHTATGYGTDLVGEAEIGAFELMGGCRTATVYGLNSIAVTTGLLVAPIRTLRAFGAARGGKALFRQGAEYDALLDLSLGELRAKLGIPVDGLARAPRRLHDHAELARADALPGAPRVRGFALGLALVYGFGAAFLGVSAIARGGASIPFCAIVAALGAILGVSAVSAKKGALGARALVGHAAIGIATTSLLAAGAGSHLAALGALPAIVLLALLARD